MKSRMQKRAAFTLAETIVSAVALSLLMAGMGSAILIASRSIPELGPQGESRLTAVNRNAQTLLDELRTARWIKSASTDDLHFSVPDRDGDGEPESIQYTWSGTAGDPLKRSYNGETSVEVLSDVTDYSLEWETETKDETYPGPIVLDPDPIDKTYESPGGTAFGISRTKSLGVCFKPDLPAGTEYWKLTEVSYSTYGLSIGKIAGVYLMGDDGLPGGEAIETDFIIDLNALPNFQWVTHTFSSIPDLSPDQGICIAVSDSVLAGFSVETTALGKSTHPDGFITAVNEGGKGWAEVATTAMLFRARSFAAVAGPDQTATREFQTGMKLVLQSGDRDMDRVRTAAQLLNRPEMLSTLWEIDFESDPTTDDRNLDGVSDWTATTSGGDELDLVDILGNLLGTGTASIFRTSPDEAFNELTTVEASMASLESGRQGPILTIHADRNGGYAAGFAVELGMEDDSTQTLTLYEKTSLFAGETQIAQVGDLPGGERDVRLLIDPDLNTLNLKIDGTDQGTFSYTPVLATGTSQSASIETQEGYGEFSYVRIRVGGNP